MLPSSIGRLGEWEMIDVESHVLEGIDVVAGGMDFDC